MIREEGSGSDGESATAGAGAGAGIGAAAADRCGAERSPNATMGAGSTEVGCELNGTEACARDPVESV